MKTIEVLFAPCCNIGHKLLRRHTGFFSCNHDRRTMCVVCAHKIDMVALHALKPNPDISLDVFHDVANVELAIGIGQGGGDEKLA